MDSELRYGLGYVLAWPFLKDLKRSLAQRLMEQVISMGYICRNSGSLTGRDRSVGRPA